MVRWTQSQKHAIDIRDKNLLISAAAGSGKTAVLVERIIQLIIQDKANIDAFLIVTFTNAAAGEMRERISSALYTAIEEGQGDEEHLRRQIQLLDRSFISTLHSFCIDVVRKYFHLIEMDPIFRIGDDTETSLLKIEALEELFESLYEEEKEAFLELVEMYGGNRSDLGLQELVIGLYDFIQSKPKPQQWLEERAEDFLVDEEGFSKSLWYESLMGQLSIELEGAKNFFTQAIEVALLPGGPGDYEEILLDDISQIDGLIQNLNLGIEDFYQGLKNIKYKRLKPAKDADKDLKEASQDLRNKGKDSIKDIEKKLLVKSPKEFVEELNQLYPYMKYLGQLAITLGEIYRSKKQERGIVDFNDLEHYALDILGYPEAVKEYREKFDYIFVDEYQDSNLIQETIVNAIKRKDNVFLVGDVKQSIYRFRLADPSLFIEKYETYQDDETSIDRRIDLSKNFRSREEILNGVNFIFKKLMSKEFGGIDYDQRAALYQGNDFPEIKDPEIEFNIIEKDNRQEEDTDLEEMGDREIEAHWIAQRIKELVQKDIYDSKQEVYRKVDYKDIVVLLRTTKGWAQVFNEVFIAQGIPVYADVSTGYFETVEIEILMNLLKIIDNKRQDIPLLSVLRSPIFGLNTQELIKIRGGSTKNTYFEALEDYIQNNDNTLSHKLKDILDSIQGWKAEAQYTPIEEFLWKLLMDTKYYYYVGSMPGGLQRQANIRLLLDRAKQFQQTSMKGLFHFIKFVDQLKSTSGDMGTAKILGENDNVVRIMSIHKSKGLEFPVVILGGLGKNFNLRESTQSVLFHKDLGLGPNYVNLEYRSYNESIAKVSMKNQIKNENLAEEMRILYVALTRPKDKLIMVGTIKNLEKNIHKWAQAIGPYHFTKSKSFLDWIGAILLRHEEAEKLRKIGQLEWKKEQLTKDDSKWKVNVFYKGELLVTQDRIKQSKENLKDMLMYFNEKRDSPYKVEVFDKLEWEYGEKICTILPSKLTVTDIKKTKEKDISLLRVNIPNLTTRPAFMEGSKALGGQERGVATHFVLQHLDLNNVNTLEDIQRQIQIMVAKELIREVEAEVVDVEKIQHFFHSPLGQRMIKAHKVYREMPFNLVKKANDVLVEMEEASSCDENILIQGIIDCFFYEDQDIILIDYKTDFYHNESSKESIVQRYGSQIELYKEAIEKIRGKKVKEAYLYLFHGNEEVRL